MTRDDIIRMAEEAGLCRDDEVWYSRSDVDADVTTDDLKRFAALVAYAKQNELLNEGWRPCALGQLTTQHCALSVRAALEEREACAKAAENQWETVGTQRRTAERCAAAIRARG